MQDIRKVQSRVPVFGGGNPASSTNSAGLVDEEGFSYKDLLQQFKDGQNKSTKKQTNVQNLKQTPVSKMPLGTTKAPTNTESPFSMMNRPMILNHAPAGFVSTSHAMGSYTKQTGKSHLVPTSQRSTSVPSKGNSIAIRSNNIKSPMSDTGGIVARPNHDAIKGDVNFDGQVNKTDKDLIAEYIARKVLDEYFHTDMADKFAKENNFNVHDADIDSDGKVNLSDLVDLDSIIKEMEAIKVKEQEIEDTKKVTKGDLNNDGEINGDDIDLMKEYLAKNNVVDNKAADFNDDGKISASDLSNLIHTFNEIRKQKASGIRGDLNNDGLVDSDDVLKLSNYIKGKDKGYDIYNDVDVDGNGEIDEADGEAIKNIHLYGKIQKPTDIIGDINNDGSVNADDQELLNRYLNGEVDYDTINNEDVNGDGAVDRNDARNLNNLIQYGKMEKPTDINGDINNDGRVDAADIDKLKDMFEGRESHINVYNANVNGDDVVDQGDMEALKNLVDFGKIQQSNGVLGDINNDGKVDANDLNRFNKYLEGNINSAQINNEDVNGDGAVDRNDARNLSNLVQYGKMEKPTDINGDINNDGRVDAADIDKLKDMFEGRESHINVYNANVNGDDVVDQRDMEALENLINYGSITKPEPPPPPPSPEPKPYQPWNSFATARIDVYEDSGLTNHLGNEKVFEGDSVDVLEENDNAYLIRYGIGTYPNYSGYKERWIEKWAIDGTNKPTPQSDNPAPQYQQWQAVISNRVPAYQDSGLTNRIGNEEVWENDRVDVLNETDNAYYVRYGVGTYPNYSEYKLRWITKGAINGASPVNSEPSNVYQPWQATVQTRMPAYHDANLTDRRNNEEVWVGDNVTILDENDRAYKMRYWSNVANDFKERWVDKAALSGTTQVNPDPAPGYQSWQATVQQRMPAYYDANLTDRRNNEEVWVGDNVTILDETDRAYKMRYWSTSINDYKERWVDKAAISGATQVNPTPAPSYQPWQATVQTRMPAYHDANLTDRRNNEEVWEGDNVTILDETDRAYKMRYWSTSINDYKERWVDKAAISGASPYVNPTNKSGWTAYAHYKKQVFTDPSLTETSGYEYVDAKEKVTIVDESDNSYKVRYWSTAINNYKERWIDKAALTEPIPPSNYDGGVVSQKLNQLHSGTAGFRDGDVYKGSGQCRGFANQVYSELFGLSGISGYSDYNYAAYSYPGSYVAGQLYNFNSNDTGAVRELFSDIKPGAIVQMGRRDRLNSDGTAARPHTAIVNSVNSDGVEFYEANVAGTNVIKTKFYSWADLARANQGFTVYMPENYPTAENKPSPPVLPGFVQPVPVTPPITPPVTPTPTPNWPPNNPIIKPVDPHPGTTTTELLPERRTGSGRVFDLTPGYRNFSYIADGGGLFIFDMNVNENKDSETPISFDLYNTQNAAGFIEYYNADGKLIGVDRVEPHSHVITDAEKWFSEAGKLLNNTLSYGWESPITDEYNSTRTKINAPKGTHSIVVTNNSTSSMYAQVSNIVDKWFESLDMISKIKDLVSSYKDLENDRINQILVTPMKEKISEHIIDNLIESGVESSLSGIKSGSQSAMDTLAQAGIQNRLKHIVERIDVGKTIADTIAENGAKLGIDMAKSVAYDMAKAAIGPNPGLVGYEAIKLIGKGLDSLDKTLTEEKLKRVKPMVFQL